MTKSQFMNVRVIVKGALNRTYDRHMNDFRRAGDTLLEHFTASWTEDEETGCWVWNGKTVKNNSGYGIFNMDNTSFLAHRVSYSHYIGEIPKGMCVLHKCHNPACVNPEHLYVGTHRQNMDDMINSGRKKKRGKSVHAKRCIVTFNDHEKEFDCVLDAADYIGCRSDKLPELLRRHPSGAWPFKNIKRIQILEHEETT